MKSLLERLDFLNDNMGSAIYEDAELRLLHTSNEQLREQNNELDAKLAEYEALLRQALEALEDLNGYRPDIDKAITALRAALAQPEQEPVAKVCPDLPGGIGWNPNLSELPAESTSLYTAPQPKAEPAIKPDLTTEPVAHIGMIDEDHFVEVCRKAGGNSNTLLYAAPQPRRRLTDEEKREMWTNATVNPCTHMHCYLRGIEDAEDAIWSKT